MAFADKESIIQTLIFVITYQMVNERKHFQTKIDIWKQISIKKDCSFGSPACYSIIHFSLIKLWDAIKKIIFTAQTVHFSKYI